MLAMQEGRAVERAVIVEAIERDGDVDRACTFARRQHAHDRGIRHLLRLGHHHYLVEPAAHINGRCEGGVEPSTDDSHARAPLGRPALGPGGE